MKLDSFDGVFWYHEMIQLYYHLAIHDVFEDQPMNAGFIQELNLLTDRLCSLLIDIVRQSFMVCSD